MSIQDQNRKDRNEKATKKNHNLLRKTSLRNNPNAHSDPPKDQTVLQMAKHITYLTKIVEEQSKMIHELRNDFKESIGQPKVSMKNISPKNPSCNDFTSEYSNVSSFRSRTLANSQRK